MELLKRAGRGDLDGLKTLIEQQVPVDTTNICNETALYHACKNGHTKVAQYLIDHGASVNLGANPLLAAVRNNSYACVQLLLEHLADINCANTEGESPMSIALKNHHCPIILLLLQYGAMPPTSLGDIAIRLLTFAKVEHAAVIHQLIDNNFIDLTSESTFQAAFIFALKHEAIELAQRMLSSDSYSQIEKFYPEAVYHSAKNNLPTILSKLFEKKVNVNERVNGQTPLYAACKEGHETVVMLLLNNGADPNITNTSATSKDYPLPLQIAVQLGHRAICDMLLANGAKLNQSRESLLHIACSGGTDVWKSAGEAVETRSVEQRLSTIRLLLQQDVDVNAVSVEGDTALYRACASRQLQVVQMLLKAGADVNLTSNQRYPVIAASSTGNAELIDLLLKSGADVECDNNNNETCLHAVITGYSLTAASQKPTDTDSATRLDVTNIIKSLLEVGVYVNARCSRSETALYRASKAGCEDIVRLLLDAGAETSGSRSRRPLYVACEQGYTQIVDLLLQHGADSNLSPSRRSGMPLTVSRMVGLRFAERKTSYGSPPICCAVQKGYTDIIHLLLKHGADVNKQDRWGKCALTYFIELITNPKTPQVSNPLDEKDLNVLKSMLSAGGDVNMLSSNTGQNALHVASSVGMCDLMAELIQHGADCNQLTSTGESALDLACEKHHVAAAAELLLNSGAKPDGKNTVTCSSYGGNSSNHSYQSVMPVLCTASKNDSETMVKMLLKHGADANLSDKMDNTALHLATSRTNVETLLNAGANVNATNIIGDTALGVLGEKRQPDVNTVELLLKFGADPNICFPLHNACKNNDPDIIRLLLTYGADANLVKERSGPSLVQIPNTMPTKGSEPSPLCFACKNGSISMVDCLLENRADVAFADSDGNTALHFAVEGLEQQANLEQYDPIVTLLLQHDAPVNVVSNNGETPLYVACIKGRTGIVKQLLDCKADVGLTTIYAKKYPLLIACERKFTDIAMMLLDCGADVDVTKDDQTPLKLAAAAGDVVLVRELLSRGADANQMQNISNTALHVAAAPRKDADDEAFADIVRRLLKSCAEPNSLNHKGETPLYLACRSTDAAVNLAIVQILLKHGAEPNMCPPYRGSSLMPSNMYYDDDHVLSPLISAAMCGNNELAILLIKFGASVDHRTDNDRTAHHCMIHYADRHERSLEFDKMYTATAETLLSAGADVNATDRTGASPLYLACTSGKAEFVKLLLNHGANPNTEERYGYPIHVASEGQHYDAVKLLLEFKADVSVCDQQGKTALHRALASESPYQFNTDKSGVLTLVQLLLDSGADVNAASKDGESPFYIACSKGLASVVAKMLEYGAKVDENNGKELPLNAACRNKHTSVLQLLLTNGANPNTMEVDDKYYHGPSLPLHIAAADNSKERVELLLKHGANVDVPDADGNTALHRAINRACQEQNVKLVEILLRHGADPNLASTSCHPDSKCKLPLGTAVEGKCDEIVASLLKAGANVNATDRDGKTAVQIATESLTKSHYYDSSESMMKKLSTVRLLLQQGADLNLVMPDSPLYLVVTALKKARRREDQYKVLAELLQLMVKYGAILLSPSCQATQDICRELLSDGTLRALATFDGKHEWIVDLFRAGVDFQLLGIICNAVATSPGEAKSITLCQAAVLAGYTPSAGELQNLQLAAARDNATNHAMEQLVSWLNDDRQQVPTLFRQCRVAIRRQLSAAVQYRTITPSVDELPLPSNMKLYLQFDGKLTEIDLSVNNELSNREPTEEISLSSYNSDDGHYEYDSYDFYDYYRPNSDHDDCRSGSDSYHGSDSDDDPLYMFC